MIDVTEGGRKFISDDFEGEEDDENKQYTKSKVEIYIDNKKTKFTRSISEKEIIKRLNSQDLLVKKNFPKKKYIILN